MAGERSPRKRRPEKEAFYSRVLNEAEKLELEAATGIDGLDEEIAVLRLKLRQLMEKYPERLDLQLNAANTIA
ncbi:MAG: hypothetical protein N3E40_05110, partial [Dehalococcoidia bacterium]|nr:hypothetical protein [Dehalococcoidia bacterium]